MIKLFSFLLFILFPKIFIFATDLANNQDVSPTDLLDNMTPLPEPQFQHTFLKMIMVLISIIFLFILTFWALKKMSRVKLDQANSIKGIKIIEKRALSPKTMLYLLEIEKEKVLIAESHLEVKRLHSLNSTKDAEK